MRIRDNFKEEPKEELKDKITPILVAAALVVVPAGIVYKVEENRIETMRQFYEVLLESETENSYLQGYIDGVFGKENNILNPVEEIVMETKDLILKIPKGNKEKQLVYIKKNTNC